VEKIFSIKRHNMKKKYLSSALLLVPVLALVIGLAHLSSASQAMATSTEFSIDPSADTTAPVISAITLSSVAPTSALIGWTTDEDSTTVVKYGKKANYGLMADATGYSKDHSINLTGLLPNTTYHFQLQTADKAGNQATSSDSSFTTLKTTDPITYATCLVTAIQKRDGAVKKAWDTFAGKVSDAFQARTAALTDAYYLATRKARTDAVKKAWTDFKNSRRDARKDFNKIRADAWTTFAKERATCKAPADGVAGSDSEPRHAD
jgi:hypothetical protein